MDPEWNILLLYPIPSQRVTILPVAVSTDTATQAGTGPVDRYKQRLP